MNFRCHQGTILKVITTENKRKRKIVTKQTLVKSPNTRCLILVSAPSNSSLIIKYSQDLQITLWDYLHKKDLNKNPIVSSRKK